MLRSNFNALIFEQDQRLCPMSDIDSSHATHFQGRIQDFLRRGCTTKEWRNWLLTGRKQILIANTKKNAGHLRRGGGGGVCTPCTSP